jgi:hypothetical protein
MSSILEERMAVVETKVGVLEDMAPKVNAIYDYMVADKANRKLRGQFFGGVAGFVALCGTIWEIFGSRR